MVDLVGCQRDGARPAVIFLFSDFGLQGPYVGEMRAAAMRAAPGVPVCDLMHDAPQFDPKRSAYLLAALFEPMPADDVVIAVVDPGVGTERAPLALDLDGRWLVGPDNGLFEVARRRAKRQRCFQITWRPASLSVSFHGRDLFAPVGARLATGVLSDVQPGRCSSFETWPGDLLEIVYIDGYGNLVTGLRGGILDSNDSIVIGSHQIEHADTFASVSPGTAFWYANSAGLVEIAANKTNAATLLGVGVGARIARRRR